MANVHYRIVEHEGGWAYKAGDGFSERYATHEEARDAAERAAAEQKLPGATEDIEYQDEAGEWHEEVSRGPIGQRQTSRDERSGTAPSAGS